MWQLGASVLCVDRQGHTPHDCAVDGEHEEVQQFLQEQGAQGQQGPGWDGTSPGNPTKEPPACSTGRALWVLPDALARALQDERQAVHISEEAHMKAARALDSWNNDVIDLQEVSGGHVLLLIGQALLEHHGLMTAFSLDPKTVHRFLGTLEV